MRRQERRSQIENQQKEEKPKTRETRQVSALHAEASLHILVHSFRFSIRVVATFGLRSFRVFCNNRDNCGSCSKLLFFGETTAELFGRWKIQE